MRALAWAGRYSTYPAHPDGRPPNRVEPAAGHAGNTDAMRNLGYLLAERGQKAEAEALTAIRLRRCTRLSSPIRQPIRY